MGRIEVYAGFWWENLKERDEVFGRSRRRRENNIKRDLQEVGCEGVSWTDVVQDRAGGGCL